MFGKKYFSLSQIGPYDALMTGHNVIMIMIQNLRNIFLRHTQNHAGIVRNFMFPKQLEKQTIDKHIIAHHDRKVLSLLSAVWIFPLLKVLNYVFEIWQCTIRLGQLDRFDRQFVALQHSVRKFAQQRFELFLLWQGFPDERKFLWHILTQLMSLSQMHIWWWLHDVSGPGLSVRPMTSQINVHGDWVQDFVQWSLWFGLWFRSLLNQLFRQGFPVHCTGCCTCSMPRTVRRQC